MTHILGVADCISKADGDAAASVQQITAVLAIFCFGNKGRFLLNRLLCAEGGWIFVVKSPEAYQRCVRVHLVFVLSAVVKKQNDEEFFDGNLNSQGEIRLQNSKEVL